MEISLIPLSESPEEASRVLSWALELWGDHFPNYTTQDWVDFYSNSAKSNYSNWVGEGQELVYLAVSGEEVVATIGIVDFDELEEFRELKPWIAAFIVNPELRGQGIGGRVLDLLEEKARSLGIEVLHLWTEDQADFYRKRGFRQIAASKLGTLDIDVMQKYL
ncbi:MAG TPA: GNAT family N-acetyltransferase [Candidatus Nanopelagicaceae bacterium]